MKKNHLPKLHFLIALGIPTVFIPGLMLASVLGWDWQKDLARLKKSGGYEQSELIFPKTVTVSKVLDGDTFETNESLTIRLIGIDAPNRGQEGYEDSKEYLTNMIDGEQIGLEYDHYQDDKYGRILAYAWESCSTSLGCENGKRLVNWVLLAKDKAELLNYKGRAPLKYEDLLKSAQE